MLPIRDHNPAGRVPYVTYALLAINAAVFLSYATKLSSPWTMYQIYDTYAFTPLFFGAGEGGLGLFTSMFLHGGWLHLAGNLLFLFIFGDNIEDELGPLPFLAFYLASGIAAMLAQFAAEPLSHVPVVGASGAIAGLMGAYLMLYPRAQVDIVLFFWIFRIFSVPAWVLLGLWFGYQLVAGIGADPDSGGVAFWAHAGGFVAGMVLILPVWLWRGGPAFWARTAGAPPHPPVRYPREVSQIPRAGRRR